ncbi:anion permease [Halobium salinum]|uniref:Phosphate transporter n=1 Tax=Halobium salinum TaxID=1364940 RepID=A0ABD5PBZ3_9EURY|nr:inorganic phosphate transporter [Halobium salinum]
MIGALLLVGLSVSLFVGYNIGGSTTGPAFGPAVGSGVLSKAAAGALMAVFFFVGAWTIGRRVVDTLGRDLVTEPGVFTIESSIVVLFFIGAGLFVGNYAGVPASTSMTAVGAIAGLGVASGTLDWAVMGEIVVWWLVAPILGFWVSGVVGRYLYPRIDRWVDARSSEGPLVEVDRSGTLPRPRAGPNTTDRELVGAALVVVIGCLMAFSSGTSNVANAIAPLYGAGVAMNPLILLACAAVAVGALTIARRTLDTLGNDLTDLPLTAALVVAVVSSGIVVGLSAVGIPASFVIIATMSIVGLGWGRASRSVTLAAGVPDETLDGPVDRSTPKGLDGGTLRTGEADRGGETPADTSDAVDLFDPETTGRVILLQNVVPLVSTVGSYAAFWALFTYWW